jgi:hypothetical protein
VSDTAAAARRPPPDPQREWAATRGVLMSYAYLGSRPQAVDSTRAENTLDLRPDLRTPAGALLASPLAITMLDAATVNVESLLVLAVTQVDLDIIDCGLDVARAHLDGRVTTQMRSQIFTEAQLRDADDLSRRIGFGTANWAVLRHSPHRYCYPQPGPLDPRWQGLPPLWHAYAGRWRDETTMPAARGGRRVVAPQSDAGGDGGRGPAVRRRRARHGPVGGRAPRADRGVPGPGRPVPGHAGLHRDRG